MFHEISQIQKDKFYGTHFCEAPESPDPQRNQENGSGREPGVAAPFDGTEFLSGKVRMGR